MLKVLNRIAWVLAISIGISIFAIDDDFFFFGFVAIFAIKLILSENFIKCSILEYNKKLEEHIISKLSLGVSSEITEDREIANGKTIQVEEKIQEVPMLVSTKKTEEKKEPSVKKPSKIAKFLNDFFAENLMAKIGGLLLALGIIFLMSLVYTYVGEVTKIIIGFGIGFSVYFLGVILEKKGFKTEGLILLGTGILINYIVILGGRFIIGDSSDGFLGAGITFGLLMLNTTFSILTSYIFTSNNLLLFSLFFAFIIPLITGNTHSTPYLQIGYGLIVSIGGLIISNYFHKTGNTLNAITVFFMSLIGGNILFLTAPFGDNSNYFIIKMIAYNILTFSSIFGMYKNQLAKYILPSFIISFIFLGIIMFSGSALSSVGILISFIIGTLGLLMATSFFILTGVGSGLLYILFLPIIFVLGFIFIGGAGSAIILLPLFLLAYLGVFIFGIGGIISNILKYIFFGIVGIFLIIGNTHLSLSMEVNLPIFITIGVTAFLFIFSNYYLSSKKDLNYLYTIGTLVGIFILLPIIKISGELTQLSIIIITLFGVINYITPFVNKALVQNDSKNLVLGSIFGILFTGSQLFRYGNEYFPGTTLGITFGVLAIIYFIGGFLLFSKIETNSNVNTERNVNFIYTFLAIAISLFSISVALVFSTLPLVIIFIWLAESSIVLFFANKLHSQKIFIAGIILFIIGLIKYFSILFGTGFYYSDGVGVAFIILSLFLNILFIKNIVFFGKNLVKILHLIGMLFVYINIVNIFNFTIRAGDLFIFSGVFVGLVGVLYNIIKDSFLKNAYIIVLSILFISHIFTANDVNNYILNYIFTLIIGIFLTIEYALFQDKKSKNIALSFGVYFFIITSIYLYYSTKDYFSLTIYWGILSLVGVHLGIGKSNKTIRAVGLLLLIVTLLKISVYDIWNGIDNPIIRVVAFMFVGGIMMYISTLYSKNKLSIQEDLSLKLGKKDIKNPNKSASPNNKININATIKDIDVSNIEKIQFKLLNGKNFTIKSKNLFKIVVLITNNTGKYHFESKELESIYHTIISNYKTEISETDYQKLLGILKDFIDIGGEVDIVKK